MIDLLPRTLRARTRLRPAAGPRLDEYVVAGGVVCALAALLVLAAVSLSVARWRGLEMGYFDFGYFDQVIWNTAHGRWFWSSFTPYGFLGQHFQPILLPFALAYRLGAGPLVLTTLQAGVTIAAAVPLYMAATRSGVRPLLAAVVAAAYLGSAYLHRALAYDFHPELMVAFPAFASAALAMGGRFRLAALLALTTLLFKEDAVFVAVALAALLWWRGGRREALVTAGVAIIWTVFLVLVLMPDIRNGYSSNVLERYSYLYASAEGSRAMGLLLAPWRAATTLADPGRLLAAALFVLGTGPLAIVRPWTLLVLAPGLAALLLSAHPPQHAIELHYGAVMLPVGVLCGLVGTSWLARRWPARTVAALVALPVLAVGVALGAYTPASSAGATPQHLAAVEAAVAMIPRDASVAAQSHLAPRVTQREAVTEFPSIWCDMDWVIVDYHGHPSSQSLAAGFGAALASVRATHTRVFERDGVEVFRDDRAVRNPCVAP